MGAVFRHRPAPRPSLWGRLRLLLLCAARAAAFSVAHAPALVVRPAQPAAAGCFDRTLGVRMSCTVLVVAAQAARGRAPMVSHSFDTAGGTDFRLVKVPAGIRAAGVERPVFLYHENALRRFSGRARGNIPEYDVVDDAAPPVQLGAIPEAPGGTTFGYWEAASGICNERGVLLAECTCSSIFGAEPLPKGRALLGYMELTRIALERCGSARDAVDTMGRLAEEHGFYGNTKRLTGAAESLAVADGAEAWIFHVLPDDTGASAIWAAQRVPDGTAAAVTNMFVIREVSLDDADNFRFSKTMLEVAQRQGLWEPGRPFDFTKIFSYGEARHKFYSGRRLWRALSLFNRDLQLPCEYDDLVLSPTYPFSVVPDRPLGWQELSRIMRDTFAGTPLDLSRGQAAGAFGVVDRYDSDPRQHGAFERPIGTYRMAYSYIGEAARAGGAESVAGDDGAGEAIIWFGPHASVTNVYLPVTALMQHAPAALASGSMKQMDRASAFWAFRFVKQLSLGHFNLCLPLLRARQLKWEEKGEAIVRGRREGAAHALLDALAADAVADWWQLADELVVRFGDGWEWEWGEDAGGAAREPRSLRYDAEWLGQVGYTTSCSEPARAWPIDAKLDANAGL